MPTYRASTSGATDTARFAASEKLPVQCTLLRSQTDSSMSVSNIKALIALGKFSSVTQKLGERLEVDAAAARLSAAHTERITFYVIVAAGVLNAAGTGLIYLLFFRRVTRPLRHATDAAARMARGDFTGAISQQGGEATALLRALAAMQAQVGGLLAEIRAAAESVLGGAGDLAHGNLELSTRTEQQASSLEETASSMEELTSTVQQNAAGARKADQLASGTSEVAAKAGRVVGDMVKTMQNIAGSSRRISEITGLIDGIAFQTNILALNAAVEAARAGDQGRGFAVVAAEVRSLAQRSAAAAKEIKQLIEASAREVDDGGRLVREAGDTMKEVVVSVDQVTQLVGAIARASSEQSDGIQQVTSAVTQMDTVVQQNAALVEQASGATDMMRAQAEALLEMVSRFQLAAGGPQSRSDDGLAPSLHWLAAPARA